MRKTVDIDLADARSGMVLAKDVMNASGQILAPTGMSITDHLVEGLRARGIVELCVCLQEDAADTTARKEHITYLFRKAGDDPLRLALRRALEQYRSEKDAVC